jgi:uncharacterized protein (DUF779 family)
MPNVPADCGPRTLLSRVAADESGTMRSQESGRFPAADASSTTLPRVVASARASRALVELRQVRGPQVLVVDTACAAISIAQVRRCCDDFHPQEHQVVLGVVIQVPVYADIQHIQLCPHDVLVVDLHTKPAGGEPTFVTRPESEAERQQRIFTAQTRKRCPAADASPASRRTVPGAAGMTTTGRPPARKVPAR